jgi:SAM-dependent methyltransferase
VFYKIPGDFYMKPQFKKMPIFPEVNDKDLRTLSKLINNPITGPLYCKRFEMALDISELPVKSILEIGYGSGFMAYALASFTQNYTGIDLHSSNKEVMNCFQKMGITNVRFFQDDAMNMKNIEMNSIDLVVSVSCLEHIKNQDAVQKEVFRVLNPGGTAIYGMPLKNILTSVFFTIVGYDHALIHPSTPDDTKRAAGKAGLLLKEEYFFPGLSKPLGIYWTGKFCKIT